MEVPVFIEVLKLLLSLRLIAAPLAVSPNVAVKSPEAPKVVKVPAAAVPPPIAGGDANKLVTGVPEIAPDPRNVKVGFPEVLPMLMAVVVIVKPLTKDCAVVPLAAINGLDNLRVETAPVPVP